MSLGGRWQKGLSHRACMASVSEQSEDQSTQGRRAAPDPQLSASQASLGPGLALEEACAPLAHAPSLQESAWVLGRQMVGLFTGF